MQAKDNMSINRSLTVVGSGVKKRRKMLNADLFQDKKDREIARLKLTIESFKKYDKDRKEYYAEKVNNPSL